jgi:hypothetical protein
LIGFSWLLEIMVNNRRGRQRVLSQLTFVDQTEIATQIGQIGRRLQGICEPRRLSVEAGRDEFAEHKRAFSVRPQ